MKIICGWCRAYMGEKPGPDTEISHSICPTCAASVLAQMDGAAVGCSGPIGETQNHVGVEV